MTVLSPSYDLEALKQYTSLPGEIYDAHSHCGHIVGPGSSFCKVCIEDERERGVNKIKMS